MKKEILSHDGFLQQLLDKADLRMRDNTLTPSGRGKREKQGTYWGIPGAKIIRKFHSGIATLPGKTRHDRNAAGHKLPF